MVVPKAGRTSVPVYGRAYPEAAAYAAYPAVPVQAVIPLQYSILAGQRYVLEDATVSTDYYRATTFAGTPPTDHVDIRSQDVYYQVSLGHRTAYVRAADVDVVPPADAGTESTDRRGSGQRVEAVERGGPALLDGGAVGAGRLVAQ